MFALSKDFQSAAKLNGIRAAGCSGPIQKVKEQPSVTSSFKLVILEPKDRV
jgi:hypothetical protein